MRYVSVINTLFKYLLGFCFFFLLGIVIGCLPLGYLYSTITDNWQKVALEIGALTGGISLSFIYVAVCRASSSRRKKGSVEKEQLVGQLFRWSFFTFFAVILGDYLEFSIDYSSALHSPGYFLVGGLFFPICCFVFSYFVKNRAMTDSTNGELQRSDSTSLESDTSEKIRSGDFTRSSNSTPFLEEKPIKNVSVMGALFKHSLALCVLFVLGLLVGVLPLGMLISFLMDVGKDAPVIGALMGAIGFPFIYVAVCLENSLRRTKDPDRSERIFKHLLGFSFFTFLGFALGFFLVAFVVPSQAYCLLGGYFFPIGYVAYHYYGIGLRTASTTQNHSMKQQT